MRIYVGIGTPKLIKSSMRIYVGIGTPKLIKSKYPSGRSGELDRQ